MTGVDPGGWQDLRPGVDVAEQLLAASRAGKVLRCGSDGERAVVAAADLRRACLASSGGAADPFGLRLAYAQVRGPLNLRAAAVPVPLSFTTCDFTDPINVEGADLHELVVTDGRREGTPAGAPESASRLPGLLGNGVRIAHDLVLSGTTIAADLATRASFSHTSAVWLTEAVIGGRLLAAGTQVVGAGGRAMQCDRTTVAGDVRLVHGFRATGEVRLLAMHLAGSLDLTGAHLSATDGPALDLAEATVGGSVFLLDAAHDRIRPSVRGRIEMGRTVIHGQLLVRNAVLEAPAAAPARAGYLAEQTSRRPVLLASGLTVHGQCTIEAGSTVQGGIILRGAELRGGVRFERAEIRNPDDVALDLSHATLGASLELRDAAVEGTVSITHARVAGPVELDGTALTRPSRRRCLHATGVRVEGDVGLQGLTATNGAVNFRGAVIAGVVDAEDAEIVNPGSRTLSLHQAQVQANVRICGRFRSVGVVVLTRATIGGRLRCDGATLAWQAAPEQADTGHRNPLGSAFEAISATVRGGIDLGWHVTAGGVDFTDATTTYLADNAGSDWPAATSLGGFSYERYAAVDRTGGIGTWDARQRIGWLAGLRPYDPRSWEQAARVLRAGGDHDGADAVLIAQRRHARRTPELALSRGRRALDATLDVTIRYGYRPQRALAILVLLIAAVTISLSFPATRATMRTTDQNARVFATAGPVASDVPAGDCGGGTVRCFNVFFYAVDTVVPIIDLKQRATWYPSPDRGGAVLEWWLNLCTILGWIASTIFVLSLTRLGRTPA